jgi:hypothetical protein
MQVQLSSLGMNKIGLVFRNPDGTFRVGPIPNLGGPFKSATDYFRAWAKSMSSNLESEPKCNHDFPYRISCMASHMSSYDRGPFPIFHSDFGYHNFLVDNQYNVVGIIDWGGSIALPTEFLQIFPMNLQSLHEIFWKYGPFDTPAARDLEVKERADQLQYTNSVKREETRLRMDGDLSRNLGGLGAEAMETLLMFEQHNQNCLTKLLDLFESCKERRDSIGEFREPTL